MGIILKAEIDHARIFAKRFAKEVDVREAIRGLIQITKSSFLERNTEPRCRRV